MTSMTNNEATEAIYARMLANVPSGISADDITFRNEPFDPPAAASWIRMIVDWGVSNQQTLGATGNRRYDRAGTILFQVFDPVGGGVQLMDGIVQDIRDTFEGVRADGIVYLDAQRRRIGVDGRWDQTNVEVAFYHEEVK
jgi:hypothetical protein